VERAAELQITDWRAKPQRAENLRVIVLTLAVCVVGAAVLASWLPLQVSIITVFLFAGPHNWFEFRYFLMRLPVRFGRSRNFFTVAFAGLAILTTTYIALPLLYRAVTVSTETWLIVLATWNTLLLAWLALLIHLRAKQKPRGKQNRIANWSWTIPLLLALAALNWLGPEFFSLAIVYAHPLVALWFLDRHLKRTRPAWLRVYRRCLCLLPLIIAVMVWRLSQTAPLGDDNGLFWRITQHSGAQLLPQVSSHVLVAVHLFLEMLHYGVWIIALPLLGPRFWNFGTKQGRFPRTALLAVGAVVVLVLWLGFAANYTDTRDLYFTIAIAHVLAEAPFLLKSL
jgi:hypothetical protein